MPKPHECRPANQIVLPYKLFTAFLIPFCFFTTPSSTHRPNNFRCPLFLYIFTHSSRACGFASGSAPRAFCSIRALHIERSAIKPFSKPFKPIPKRIVIECCYPRPQPRRLQNRFPVAGACYSFFFFPQIDRYIYLLLATWPRPKPLTLTRQVLSGLIPN